MPTCSNCGSKVAQTARFCPRCGGPQRELAARQDAVPFPAPRGQESWDLCEIVWWRGYVKSEFYALGLDADRREYEIARSPQFRWYKADAPPPDNTEALRAHETLVAKLVAGGWETLGSSTPWYAGRFRRRATSLRLLSGAPPVAAGEEESDSA
jgi:hypothetical protein